MKCFGFIDVKRTLPFLGENSRLSHDIENSPPTSSQNMHNALQSDFEILIASMITLKKKIEFM